MATVLRSPARPCELRGSEVVLENDVVEHGDECPSLAVKHLRRHGKEDTTNLASSVEESFSDFETRVERKQVSVLGDLGEERTARLSAMPRCTSRTRAAEFTLEFTATVTRTSKGSI